MTQTRGAAYFLGNDKPVTETRARLVLFKQPFLRPTWSCGSRRMVRNSPSRPQCQTRSLACVIGRPRLETLWVTTSKECPMGTAVVRRGTAGYAADMAAPDDRSMDVSVRQFVADSGSVTRGLRQGRSYTLTLNGEPLARMIPIRRRRAVPKEEVLAIFATAPAIDAGELRADLDDFVDQEVRDPFEETGL